jgi:hypothetical protein
MRPASRMPVDAVGYLIAIGAPIEPVAPLIGVGL